MAKSVQEMTIAELKQMLKDNQAIINAGLRQSSKGSYMRTPVGKKAQASFDRAAKELAKRQGKTTRTIDEVVRPIDRSPKAQRERMIRARQRRKNPIGGAAATRKAAPALRVAPVVKKAAPAKPVASAKPVAPAKPTAPKAKAKPKRAMKIGKPGYNRRTVSRKTGGSMKPKGVGCAMRGYGGAMK